MGIGDDGAGAKPPVNMAAEAQRAGLSMAEYHKAKIYAGPMAAKATGELGAQAYAAGGVRVWDPMTGPKPGTGAGLVGHEAVHVVQQRGPKGSD